MKDLVEYMKYRAAAEKTLWDIPEQFLEAEFKAGIRDFFGVRVTDGGGILEDSQNPGALAAYRQQLTYDCKGHDSPKVGWTGDRPRPEPAASDLFYRYVATHELNQGAQLDLLAAWFGDGLVKMALERLDQEPDASEFEKFLVENFDETEKASSLPCR